MEQDLELKFVCKLCNKKYPCGKSLGGHMRSHVVANSAESDEKFEKNSYCGEFANGQSSYGLRENPRKTWRAVDSNAPLPLEKICKQCGKGFQSLKALCGHMAYHADRDKGLKDDYSWTSENQKLVNDSCSDSEEGDELRLRSRSSKGKKQKNVIAKCNSFSLANNCSSSVSEIDGQDHEEVAMCLMMLSRDYSGNYNKGGVNSVVESSDNNSVVLEPKSSSLDMRNKNGGLNYNYSPKIGDVKLKEENSDSGYFLDECNKAESDVSVDGFRRNDNFRESKKPFVSDEGRGEEYGYEFRKSLKRKDLRNHEYYDDSNFGGIESSKTAKNSAPNLENSQKRSKYECFNCRKTFKSYQALGGHRPCHKRSNAYYELTYESGENSLEDSMEFRTATNRKSSAKNSSQDKKAKSKKNKGHVCPFCDRVFKNGQALGGHKRSHFLGGHEQTSRAHVKKPELPDFIDLNLPAPEEDEDDARGQFLPW